jgi:predicted transcriptional regulator
MATKTMSLRLPEDLAADLDAVARADDVPVSVAIRDAIQSHIAARRGDQAFQARLKQRLREDQKVLRRLVK